MSPIDLYAKYCGSAEEYDINVLRNKVESLVTDGKEDILSIIDIMRKSLK